MPGIKFLEKKHATEWHSQFPQLSLLHTHYSLPSCAYSLSELVIAIDAASLGDLILKCGAPNQSHLFELSESRGMKRLCALLQRMMAASFMEVLSNEEVDALWKTDCELAPFKLQKDETSEQFVRRVWEDAPRLEADTDFIEVLLGCIPFTMRTELALSVGGDDRLTLQMNANKINKYCSSTIPRSSILVRRGSCTCSTIVPRDYITAETFRVQSLISFIFGRVNRYTFYESLNERIRFRIGSIIETTSTPQGALRTVLFPSGSDAEFLPLIVGILRYKKSIGYLENNHIEARIGVTNFITAGGEVGSGTPNACGGKHFSNVSPNGMKQSNNTYLDGIDSGLVEVVQFTARGSDGSVEYHQQQVLDAVREVLSKDTHRVAVLHIVCGSKTGLVYPSLGAVKSLQSEYKDRLVVVVDACQLRCKLSKITEYVSLGFIVLITGSKFFTGPPFCGAVILPVSIANEIEGHISTVAEGIPEGLKNYLTSHDIPAEMPKLKNRIKNSSDWVNFPLTLRWNCALDIMEKFHRIRPEHLRSLTIHWVSRLKQMITTASPYLKLVEVNYDDPNTDIGEAYTAEMLGDVNSIISVSIHVPQGLTYRHLSFEETKSFFEIMTGGSEVYMLGQPVKISSATGLTVLRIALGADMIVDALYDEDDPIQITENINMMFAEDAALISAMVNLAREWSGSSAIVHAIIDASASLSSHKNIYKSGRTVLKSLTASTTLLQVSQVVESLVAKDRSIPNLFLMYDLDAIDAACSAIRDLSVLSSFKNGNCELKNCFALKACPISFIAHKFIVEGQGIECASIMEVKHAIELGCEPSKIVYDSPCKTIEEIQFALEHGVFINANSLNELVKIDRAVSFIGLTQLRSVIGVRVNPLVGSGSIAALSTATASSKFGVIVTDFKTIVELFKKYSFLSALMSHVGSQGMSLHTMATAAVVLSRIADEVDKEFRYKKVSHIDIGGGLSLNYTSDVVTPSFQDYFDEIVNIRHDFFQCNRTIYTEFGRSLVGKAAAVISKVEDVLLPSSSSVGDSFTAITHCGADLFLRPVYCPEKFHHRLGLLNESGSVVTTDHSNTENSMSLKRKIAKVTVSGPLCFSGDNIAVSIDFPVPIPGDHIVALDSGANTLSLFSRHCSRLAPAAYAFRAIEPGFFSVVCIKEEESEGNLLKFWR